MDRYIQSHTYTKSIEVCLYSCPCGIHCLGANVYTYRDIVTICAAIYSTFYSQRKPQKSVLLPRWSLSLLATAEKAETQLAMKASASSIRAMSNRGSSSVPYTIFSYKVKYVEGGTLLCVYYIHSYMYVYTYK